MKNYSARGITGVASHGKHTRATEHVKKLGNKIEQNFFTCSVTPCMLTMTMLPEKMLVRVY